jgi:hypothetical protein
MGEFAKTTEAKYEDGYIRFTWKEAGEPRLFEISGEALMQSFGAADDSGKELMDALERGRKHIADAAREASNTPTDGIIELGSGDFEQGSSA